MKIFNWALFLSFFFFSFESYSQDAIREKEDLVQGSPLESFSSKAEAWPVDSVSQEILQTQGTSIYEALNKYPSIQTRGESSGGSPSIRIRGAGSSARTLMLFDGTPLNGQDGTGANPLLLPMELVENVDIIKGPSSLFYGSDAVGGALNLKPRKLLSPIVRLGYESTEKPSLFLGSPFLQKENYHLQGSIYVDSSEGDFSYNDPTLGKTKRKNNDRKKQRYSLIGENKIYKTSLSHHFIYAREKGKSPGSIHSPFVTEFDRKAFLGSILVQQRINPSWNINYKASFTQADDKNNSDKYFVTKNLHSLSTDYQILNYSNLEIFTDFSRDDFESVQKLHDDHFEHGMIFRSQVSDQEFLLAGLRYFPDQNKTVKNILLKQDHKDYILWASYSEGLRIPDLVQRFINIGGIDPFIGNPSLRPETSNQIEIGAETSYKKHKFKISAYSIEYKDFIQYVSPPAPYSYENVEKVSTRGIELQASTDYKIYHALLSYSLMESKDERTGQRMPLIPTSQAYLVLGAQLAAFVFEAHNTFWSSYKLDNTNESKSWYTLDLTMRTSGFNDWNFKTGVLNLLGKEREFTYGYPEPKTQFFAFIERAF